MLFQAGAVLAAAGLVAGSRCKPHSSFTSSSSSSTSSSSTSSSTSISSSSTIGWENVYTATASASVAAAAATAKTSSPTSKVKGKVFDRYVSIWFENTDYAKAIADPNFAAFAKQGITLSNLYAVTHPSEPNYISVVGGDYFGMQNDNFNQVDFNVSTVFDLLDHKHISWGLYQEDMPYSGFEGQGWVNQKTGANDYVRKHNPAVIFNSVAHFEDRLSQIKNLSLIDESKSQFHADLKANKLPQWLFITPNMTSDAHDATISFAGNWLKTFLTPLLTDKNFMDNTLVLITFDENSNYALKNNILSFVLGDAVPAHLAGTTDASFYNHYSELSTVEANWDLPTLGRWDVGANVFQFVAEHTGDTVRKWDASFNFDAKYFFNTSYAGPFNTAKGGVRGYPAPNLELDKSVSGRKILESIKQTWKGSQSPTYYRDAVEVNDGLNPPAGYSL